MQITPEQQAALLAFYEAAKAYDEANEWEPWSVDDEDMPAFFGGEDHQDRLWGALDQAYEAFGYETKSRRPYTWKDGEIFGFTFKGADETMTAPTPAQPPTSA